MTTLERDAAQQLNCSTRSLSEACAKPSQPKVDANKSSVCLSTSSLFNSAQGDEEGEQSRANDSCWRQRKPSELLDSTDVASLNSDVDDSTPFVVMSSVTEKRKEKLETAAQILPDFPSGGLVSLSDGPGGIDWVS